MTVFIISCEIEVEAPTTAEAFRKLVKDLGQVEEWQHIKNITYTGVN